MLKRVQYSPKMSTFAKLRKKINSPYPLPQNPPHHGFLRQAKHITEGGWEKDVNKGTPLPQCRRQ